MHRFSAVNILRQCHQNSSDFLGRLHYTILPGPSSGTMGGVQPEFLFISSSPTSPIWQRLGKVFHLFIALAVLHFDDPFSPPSAGVILPIAGGSVALCAGSGKKRPLFLSVKCYLPSYTAHITTPKCYTIISKIMQRNCSCG